MHKLTALLAGLAAMPAIAQPEGSPVVVEGGLPTAVVSYADLDLSSSSGITTLNGRISRAASQLCIENGHKDLPTKLSEARCFRTAVASAKPQVDLAIAGRTLASSGSIKVAAR